MSCCGANRPNDLLADGLLTVAEAVEFSRLSRSELFKRMSDSSLTTVLHGRRRLIPRMALVEMLARGLTRAD